MPVTDVTTDPEELTMTLSAEFAAPVERVWQAFTDPRELERFWGPPGWPATFTEFDLTVGGRVRYEMVSQHGEHARGAWEFLSIEQPTRFEVIDSFVDEDGAPSEGMPPGMRVTYDFEPTADGCRLRSVTYFTSVEALEEVIAMGAIEGSTMAMNQLDRVLAGLRAYAQGKGTQVEMLDDAHVRITRLIEGPRELVWRAHHEPDLLRRWMLGPDGWSMTTCEVAPEVGQTYRYEWVQNGVEGSGFGFEGETLLVDPPRRAATTERMIGTDGPTVINDLTLEEEDGATLLTLVMEYPDAETRDMILATGMAEGMETSYARLESVLAGETAVH
ncbi:SRPBCC family protein [Microbacterium sp. zg-YB36]|uniref:SRPBCC family protein n=1 Tax=Microbacterium sp. zg-YB36 TaxID=2969407 RepID=UPI00214D10FE|nr:SRPBCC family protein [Microbacterium sp. zg-YB36]MDL5352240.1 SRPBCC family protein [Microbacterium sp. zg-YB36]